MIILRSVHTRGLVAGTGRRDLSLSVYWRRDKSPGLLACTVHIRAPNRGIQIGRQKSNRVGLIPRKQNGGFPQEASNLVFNDAVGRRGEKNDQHNSVTRDVETLHPVSIVSPSLSDSFSAILKQGAMEGEF